MKNQTIEQFLTQLRNLDVKFWNEGDGLRYKAPKNALTPELLTEIKKRKPEILTFLQEAQNNVKVSLPPLLPNPNKENLPLSFAQQRLWFLAQFESDSSAYNMSRAFHLKGELNLAVLEQSFLEIIKRHEVLRTVFPTVRGEPIQVILPDIPFEVSVTDSQEVAPDQKNLRIQQWLTDESQQTFDLSKGSLIRVKLLRLGLQEHILLFTVHHIISDGWSMGIFMTELSNLYLASVTNTSPSLPPLAIQYADFTLWQHQWLTKEVLQNQTNYWLQQLADLPPILELPIDKSRPALQTFSGAYQSFRLSEELTQKIKVLCQQEGVTLYMALLTAFGILLFRYSQQEDITIGTPISNRNRTEIETLIGCFVNTLVMRLNLEGNPRVSELLKRVRKMAQSAYANQDLPYEKLVEKLQPERHLSHSPLFQVMFILQNVPQPPLDLAGLAFNPLEINKLATEFDLTLTINEINEGLDAKLEYNTDLFEAGTIRRMIGHFQCLLEVMVTNPETKVAHLPLLSESEKHQLLVEWNQTEIYYPKNKCIHQLFEEQVEKNPNAIAVIFEDKKLTYQQLNEKANQLAHYLRKLGVKPESLVGIYLERSLEMIISILGILKAGGAYVPIDVNYPQERIKFMLEDAHINLVITESKLKNKLPEYQENIIKLDSDYQAILNQPKHYLETQINSENLAYLIYTSGSTGKPKGVKIAHKSVNRLVRNCNYLEIKSTDKIAQIANTSFDAATFEIWGALLNGANLVIFSQETVLELDLFIEKLKEQKIDTIFITTALFNQIANLYPEGFKTVKNVLFGGEKCNKQLVEKILKQGKPEQLIHVYGPTENTTFSSYYIVNEVSNDLNLPIGKPINNTQIYILDSHLQPVPIGVSGEIYLAGEGIAKGYLNRPELTSEKFIDNPFESGKLYKTGDLAKYLPNGNIEFIGRIDNQVKIRGFRIELGEIEATLNQYPDIKDTVVIAQENSNNKYLISYIISKNKPLVIEEIKSFLQQKLPDYMIPSGFIFLDKFPLTPNGKIDKKALPKPNFETNKGEKEFIAPRNEMETNLTKIWQEILGVEKISINDDFFALGGNSLLTIRLVYEIEKQLGQKVPVKTLFELVTIENLANSLRLNNYSKLDNEIFFNNNNDCNAPQLTDNEKRGLLASTTSQKRISNSSLLMLEKKGNPEKYRPLFFVYLLGELAENLPDYLPVYHLIAWTKVEKPKTFIKALASYFVDEILKVQPTGPYYLAGYCVGGLVALEIAQQLKQKGEEVAMLLLVQTRSSDKNYLKFQRLLNDFGYKYYLSLLTNLRIISSLDNQEKVSFFINKIKTIFNKVSNDNDINTNNDQLKSTSSKNEILEQEILASFKQTIRYYQAESYSGKVALFFSTEGGAYSFLFPKGGWKNLLTGEVSVDLVPGNHTGLLKTPYVQLLTELIVKKLQIKH